MGCGSVSPVDRVAHKALTRRMSTNQKTRGPMARILRPLALLALSAVLAACASSTVTRTGGSAGSTPKYGATTVVKRGDNLYRIATDNGISTLDLAAWNNIPPPYTIYPGQRLKLYPDSSAGRMPPRSTAGTRAGTATPPPARPQPPASRPAPTGTAVANSVKWNWPVDGSLLSSYRDGDPTRQGIDIAATGGAPVRATADGTVVYSGSGLVGYGELIIIKHSDQWLSAYGHNRNRMVNEGELVKGGQQIAEVGRSGASRDMLHFEIRYNGKPVDPLLYLPKR